MIYPLLNSLILDPINFSKFFAFSFMRVAKQLVNAYSK